MIFHRVQKAAPRVVPSHARQRGRGFAVRKRANCWFGKCLLAFPEREIFPLPKSIPTENTSWGGAAE